jgi:hypothetical protein
MDRTLGALDVRQSTPGMASYKYLENASQILWESKPCSRARESSDLNCSKAIPSLGIAYVSTCSTKAPGSVGGGFWSTLGGPGAIYGGTSRI